jgi:tight adherence protein C
MTINLADQIYFAEKWLLAILVMAALLSAHRLWRITRREEIHRARLAAFRGAASTVHSGPEPWYRRLGSLVAISPIVGTVEQHRLLKLLTLAGIKGRSSLANFMAIKVCIAVVLAGLTWTVLELHQLLVSDMLYRILVLGSALLGGWRVPDFILNRMIKRRQLRLEQGMPDALDMLVVCSESGLSLNQAIGEVSLQLRLSNEDVAYEFGSTAAEMRIVPDFSTALDNMVERTGLDELRSLVATLKQSLKFGTSLAESLRIIAAEMRAVRQARMEERAARLPVLLAIPMLLFILPCLFMIVGTPVAVRIIDLFKNMTFGGAL